MPGLTIYTGNRLELLAEDLAALLSDPLPAPLTPEVVMVQSRGMERWLRMQLARAHGICANIRFPFPNHFLKSIFSDIFPDLQGSEPYSPAVLAWRIMGLLSECPEEPSFRGLGNYLNSGEGDLRSFQLSSLIADTFDQYLLFRPEMIFRWEAGEEDHWQAGLWRMISSGNRKGHRAALARDFLLRLGEGGILPGEFPQRVSVFGISVLPRFHMELLAAIGSVVDIHLFLMNPCMEYWGDVTSERTKLTRARKAAEAGAAGADLYIETGNPLLSSFGTLGRDFFDMAGESPHLLVEHFEEPGTDTLLHCIQSDILHMRNRAASGERTAIAPEDTSLRIHSCHSPMREMEVLHDVLLDLLEKDPALRCEDVLVMTPDIDGYAPFIRSVFDKGSGDRTAIPFSIADRSLHDDSPVARALMQLLDLCGGRHTASAVVEILEAEPVAARFGIQRENLATIKRWIRENRICWGLDGEHKTEEGLPGFDENTWAAGLSRLLLGYAMPAEDERTFQDIYPFDGVEGQEAELLGKLCSFLKHLFGFTRGLRDRRPPARWALDLKGPLDSLFADFDPFSADLKDVRESVDQLRSETSEAGFSGAVDLATVKWFLAGKFRKIGHGSGFITRGVTFCAMLPMRSIPFEVVCLVGMNSDSYPRRSSPPGFDLIAAHPRKGDRSRRTDDRYLFLEALLSARKTLHISYVGRSIRDNSRIPPSVAASELLDYVSQSFTCDADMENRVIVAHPLQPFSPEYFKPGATLFSYSAESLEAARAARSPGKQPAPFVSKPLPPDETDRNRLSIQELCSFFTNPARYFLRNRIGIFLDDPGSSFEEREPFALAGLERYHLENRMLSRLLSGRGLSDLFRIVRSEGLLPHGNVGKHFFDESAAGVEAFAGRLLPFLEKPVPAPLEAGLSISQFELAGPLDGITTEGRLAYRYAPIRPGDMITAWIKHLVLCAVSPPGIRKASILAGLSSERSWRAVSFGEISDPEKILGALLELYRDGLCRPLPFSPASSWMYMDAVLGDLPKSVALDRARAKWEGSEWSRGEAEDPYNDLCFRETGLVDLPGFTRAAEEVFRTLISHMEDAAEDPE